MKPMNILISSVGRRAGLVQCFRESLEKLGLRPRVFGVDITRSSPAFHLCDKAWIVGRCTEPGFVDEILNLCQRENVGLVILTIDTELAAYAEARSRFHEAGILVGVSSPETIRICSDKSLTNRWLRTKGFPTVHQRSAGQVLADGYFPSFPAIAKPRFGSSSVGIRRVGSIGELRQMVTDSTSEYVVEELAPGLEHTVNFYVDGQGHCLCVVPHYRMEVRGGEVSKGVTVKSAALMDLGARLGESLPGAFGALNFQCFVASNGEIRIFEINGRFGGGYPLVHRAGGRFSQWLVEEAGGLPSSASFEDWEDDLAMLRYDEAVFLPGVQVREGKDGNHARSCV